MKTICKKSIVISIILLLIGVSVSSAISVDTKSTTSNNQIEECRECNEVSDADLVKVERLLDKAEVYSKLLLVLSRHNPELRENIEGLSNEITFLKTLNPLNDIICDILESTYESIGYAYLSADELYNSLPEDSIFRILIIPWLMTLEFMIYIIFSLIGLFYCWGPYHP